MENKCGRLGIGLGEEIHSGYVRKSTACGLHRDHVGELFIVITSQFRERLMNKEIGG